MKQGYIYIITNKKHGVLYTGCTSHLSQRITQHQQKLVSGFSQKYNLTKLVYYEEYNDIRDAIMREKQIKKRKRQRKINLIESINPERGDLSYDISV